ncbi:MAG: xanthine dehydrogenase family protein subunit M [Mesorhizobium sp.]
MSRYSKPESLEEALSLLGRAEWRVLSGGTDFYPAQGARPVRDDVIDIAGISLLRGIEMRPDGLWIGARTTWTDIVRAELPPACDALKQAAREVGSVQIQNVGTVAGNLCNASPAADGVPPLMMLDAEVELRSTEATRRLALGEFILGNRRTVRRSNELVTAVVIPTDALAGQSAFCKLGARRYLVISIAMAAARLVVEGGRVEKASVAIGACSEVARRLPELERDLVGAQADDGLLTRIGDRHFDALKPIDDVRGSAEYRRAAAREIVAEALKRALSGTPPARVAA